MSRAVIAGPFLLEQVQYVLGTIGRPHRKKVVIAVLQASTTTHGDKSQVPLLAQDHLFAHTLAYLMV
jgi:hypothetical protein